jgi:hypothetical protein
MIYRILFVLITIILALVLFYLLTRDTTQDNNTTNTQLITTVKEGFDGEEALLTEDELTNSVKVIINDTVTADEIRTIIADVGEGVDVYEYDDDLYILATARFDAGEDDADADADAGEDDADADADAAEGEDAAADADADEGEDAADPAAGDTFRNIDGQRQLIFEPELPQESIDALIALIEEEGDDIIITNTATTQATTTTQSPTTIQSPTTTTNPLNAYNQVINRLDALITDDRRAEIPNELKIDILELPQTQRESLCDDYCQIYEGGCTPLCNFLGCNNCTRSSQNQQSVYRQPDEANQAQVPRTQGNTQIPESPPNPMNISQSGNGESNIFAPYVVVHKKKPGERYNAYVMTNPHDPNYYNYINNLS